MAFSHGRTARFLVGGFDLSDTTKQVNTEGSNELVDITGFQNTSKRFLGGLKSGKVSASGLWSGTADGRYAAVSSDIADENYGAGTLCISHYPAGDTIGNKGWATLCTETGWNFGSDVNDAVTYSLEGESSIGKEPVVSHFAIGDAVTLAYNTSGTATVVDNSAATTNGAAGYLHNFQISAGTCAVKIQHSSDDSTYVDLITFSDVTTADPRVSERIAATGTVNRYTRCVYTMTGGSASFHAGLARL